MRWKLPTWSMEKVVQPWQIFSLHLYGSQCIFGFLSNKFGVFFSTQVESSTQRWMFWLLWTLCQQYFSKGSEMPLLTDMLETFKFVFPQEDFHCFRSSVPFCCFITYIFQVPLSPMPEPASVQYTLSSFCPEFFNLYIWAKNERVIGHVIRLQTCSVQLHLLRVGSLINKES